MFETVVPATVVRPSRRVLYETLPISLAVHALAVGGFVVSSIWSVAFPSQSPRITVAYSLIKIPDPPPPPPPSPQPAAAPKPQAPKLAPPPPALTQIVAPTIIPDFIPQVAEAAPDPPPPPEAPPAAAAPPPQAVAGGNPKGDGLLGGAKFGSVGGIVFADDGRVHVDRKEKLPLKVLDQEFPTYPDAARKDRLEDSLVVRYTVGTNGHINDVAIIEHAKHPIFEEQTLDVIRRWRFRPLTINGKAVEVVHEVEFFYQFIAH